MCGLVGAAGDLSFNHEKAFKDLLIFDVIRGEHSTGVLGVQKFTAHPVIVKQLGAPHELFNDLRWERISKSINKVLLGHNRYATQGTVNKRNAHPFEFGTVIGAHNGTVSNKHALVDGNKFDVDSQAIFNSIDQEGVEETITKLKGAFALTWWNMADDTINFIRNSDRPLYISWTEDKKAVFWASEAWMLEIALSRHSIKFEKPGMLVEENWLSIPVEDKGVLGKGVVKKIHCPKYQPVIYGSPANKQTSSSNASNANSNNSSQGGQSNTKNTNNVLTLPSKNLSKSMPGGVLGSKCVLLELGMKSMTNDGGKYIMCENPLMPDVDIRLFYGRDDVYVDGDIITGDIQTWVADGGYFKVTPLSVKVVEMEDKSVYYDFKGNALTKEQFEKKYPYCAWCNSDINAEDEGNFLFNDGDCLCPDCAADETIKAYAN